MHWSGACPWEHHWMGTNAARGVIVVQMSSRRSFHRSAAGQNAEFEKPWRAMLPCADSQTQCCPCCRCPSHSYMGSMTGWTPRLASASARRSAQRGASSAPQTWRWRSYLTQVCDAFVCCKLCGAQHQTQVCNAFVCCKLCGAETGAAEPHRLRASAFKTQVHEALCAASCN